MDIDFPNLERKSSSIKKSENNSTKDFIKELQKELLMNKGDLFTIDRFEGEYAVCENRRNRKTVNIPITFISRDAKEGDIIQYRNGKYIMNKAETINAKEKIKKKVNEVYKKNK